MADSELIINLNDKINTVDKNVAVLTTQFTEHSTAVTAALEKIASHIDDCGGGGASDEAGKILALIMQYPKIAAVLAFMLMTAISSLSGGAIARQDLQNIISEVADVPTGSHSNTPLSE